jgi:hypothetical protein
MHLRDARGRRMRPVADRGGGRVARLADGAGRRARARSPRRPPRAQVCPRVSHLGGGSAPPGGPGGAREVRDVDDDDDLDAWIAGVRGRLDRGELKGLDPVALGPAYAAMRSGELAVRVLLADVGHHRQMPPGRRADPANAARWRLVRGDLLRLRALLG